MFWVRWVVLGSWVQARAMEPRSKVAAVPAGKKTEALCAWTAERWGDAQRGTGGGEEGKRGGRKGEEGWGAANTAVDRSWLAGEGKGLGCVHLRQASYTYKMAPKKGSRFLFCFCFACLFQHTHTHTHTQAHPDTPHPFFTSSHTPRTKGTSYAVAGQDQS